MGRRGHSRPVCLAAVFFLALAACFLIFGGVLFGGRGKIVDKVRKLLDPLDARDLNILFFTLDTTRADHIGCYGYSLIETPNIDRLAGQGFLFKNAISQSPLTLPSHASIFTGTYPFFHGVRDNGGFYSKGKKRL